MYERSGDIDCRRDKGRDFRERRHNWGRETWGREETRAGQVSPNPINYMGKLGPHPFYPGT